MTETFNQSCPDSIKEHEDEDEVMPTLLYNVTDPEVLPNVFSGETTAWKGNRLEKDMVKEFQSYILFWKE